MNMLFCVTNNTQRFSLLFVSCKGNECWKNIVNRKTDLNEQKKGS